MKRIFLIASTLFLSATLPAYSADNIKTLQQFSQSVVGGGDVNGDGNIDGYDWYMMSIEQKVATVSGILLIVGSWSNMDLNRITFKELQKLMTGFILKIEDHYYPIQNRKKPIGQVFQQIIMEISGEKRGKN